MKLYYSPGACSLNPHIILRETNTPVTLVKTDIRGKKTEDGRDFLAINPRGYVPVLELDDGTILTEGPAIVQYVADKAGATSLAPPAGTMERYRVIEWLNFVSTELHKGFSPLFNPAMPAEGKAVAAERLLQRIGALDRHLEGKDYIMGKAFTLPDAYAFVTLSWSVPTKLDLTPFKNIAGYRERIAQRPAVQAAMKAEGLMK